MFNQNKVYRVLELISFLKTEPPKSIKYISAHFLISERSVYRYLYLIDQLGYGVEKTKNNKYFIGLNEENNCKLELNRDEIEFLKDLLLPYHFYF